LGRAATPEEGRTEHAVVAVIIAAISAATVGVLRRPTCARSRRCGRDIGDVAAKRESFWIERRAGKDP
jgi:hypothetical protein